VPSAILTGCSSLATLKVHGNPKITAESLRETPGWADMDARRRAKHDKQLERGVMLGRGGMEEGMDVDEVEHW
jgi:hypothetical protein